MAQAEGVSTSIDELGGSSKLFETLVGTYNQNNMAPLPNDITKIAGALSSNPNARDQFYGLIMQVARDDIVENHFEDPLAFAQTVSGPEEVGAIIRQMIVLPGVSLSYDANAPEEGHGSDFRPKIVESYYVKNFDRVYPLDISDTNLRYAFRSYADFNRMVAQQRTAVSQAIALDMYGFEKQIFAGALASGTLVTKLLQTNASDSETDKNRALVSQILEDAALAPFPNHNNGSGMLRGVSSDLILLVTPQVYAAINVYVQSTNFHNEQSYDKLPTIAVIDNFGNSAALSHIKGILLERNFILSNINFQSSMVVNRPLSQVTRSATRVSRTVALTQFGFNVTYVDDASYVVPRIWTSTPAMSLQPGQQVNIKLTTDSGDLTLGGKVTDGTIILGDAANPSTYKALKVGDTLTTGDLVITRNPDVTEGQVASFSVQLGGTPKAGKNVAVGVTLGSIATDGTITALAKTTGWTFYVDSASSSSIDYSQAF